MLNDTDKALLLARLKKSDADLAADAITRGRASGQSWAMHTANKPALVRLSAWADEDRDPDDIARQVELADEDAYGAGNSIATAVIGDPKLGRQESSDFWDCHTGDPASEYDLAFLTGFVAGALAVYDEVKADL